MKRKLPIALIIVTAAVIVIGGGVAAAFLGVFGNGTYESAEKANFTAIKAFSAIEDAAGSLVTTGKSVDFDFSYEPSEAIKTMLFGTALEEMGMDLDKFTAAGNITELDGEMAADIDFSADDISINILTVLSEEGYVIAYPGISDYYQIYSTSTRDGETTGTVLDKTAFAKTISNIEDEYFKLTERIGEVTKDVEITGGGITVKADEYEFVFTKRDVYDLAKFAVAEFRANENLCTYVFEKIPFRPSTMETPADLVDLMEETIEEKYNESEDDDTLDDTALRMRAAVHKNVIVSRTIDKIDGYAGDSLSYDVLYNSKEAYFKALIKEAGSGEMTITGEAAIEGEVWNGDLKFVASDKTEMKITGTNITVKDKIVTGEFDINAYAEDENTMEFTIILSEEDGSQILEANGSYMGTDVGSLRVKSKTADVDTINIPEFDPDYAVDMMNLFDIDDDTMSERYEHLNDDMDTFLSKLLPN
jgi:hypothetical protein